MKMIFLKQLTVAAALLSAPAVMLAQQTPEKKESKTRQQIVITRSGEKDEKMTIEIDGDKVKVNGKDVTDLKDINVRINNLKLPNLNLNPVVVQGYSSRTRDGQMQVWRNDSLVWHDQMNLFKTDSNRAMLGVGTDVSNEGVVVKSITEGTAAEKAGLKKGDIITRIDTRRIQAVGDVTDAVRSHKPGDKVTITYLRDAKEYKSTAELSRWKGIDMKGMTTPRVFGVGRIDSSRALAGFDGFQSYDQVITVPGYPRRTRTATASQPKLGLLAQDTDDGKGVKVVEVEEEGTAAKSGIQENDIVTHVDGVAVNSADEIAKAVREKKDQPSMKFQILRKGKAQTIEVKVPRKIKSVDI